MTNATTYYEINGSGHPLVFIHGGLVSLTMWRPQVDHFAKNYRVITYDIRGHGRTGGSQDKAYSVNVFAHDLKVLLDDLEIEKPIICGLSLGGMIAQTYATIYPNNLRALILSDTAISTSLTVWDKLMVYVLFPKWLMLPSLRLMGVANFIRFSFWIAKLTRGDKWLGSSEVSDYEKREMLNIPKKEYLKIFAAIYDYKLQDLSNIRVPTLVLNGEYESRSVQHHAEIMQLLIPDCEAKIIPNAGHTANLENPAGFNEAIDEFLGTIGISNRKP